MRILFLTQWFQPEPAFKGLPLAKAFRDRGHEVEVLTGFPNYPGGNIYPGYRIRLLQRDEMDNIRINRVALYPSHDKSGLRRSINYLSFGMSSAVIGNFLIKKPDVIYAYNLVTLGFSTGLFRARFRCPIVYDLQDLWPDSVIESGMLKSPILAGLLECWCKYIYRSATHLIALSPGMKREIVRRGSDESRVTVVYDWCDEEHIRPMPRDSSLAAHYGLDGRFVVMFAGTMGVMQRLESLLAAAEQLLITEPNISLVFVGGGVERSRLVQIALDKKLSNVVFIERQPMECMAPILSLADVMVVHLKGSIAHTIAIPSKIQAYFAAGKPVIAGIRGDGEAIILESGAGKVIPPDCPSAFTDAIRMFYKMPAAERERMGLKGLKYYKTNMSMEIGTNRTEKIFFKCLNGEGETSTNN